MPIRSENRASSIIVSSEIKRAEPDSEPFSSPESLRTGRSLPGQSHRPFSWRSNFERSLQRSVLLSLGSVQENNRPWGELKFAAEALLEIPDGTRLHPIATPSRRSASTSLQG